MIITEETAQRLNDNIERLISILEPKSSLKKSKTFDEQVEECSRKLDAKYAKKHLKELLKNK